MEDEVTHDLSSLRCRTLFQSNILLANTYWTEARGKDVIGKKLK
jgi:hypothetical protein